MSLLVRCPLWTSPELPGALPSASVAEGDEALGFVEHPVLNGKGIRCVAGPPSGHPRHAADGLTPDYSMAMIWFSSAQACAKAALASLPWEWRLAPRARQSKDLGWWHST